MELLLIVSLVAVFLLGPALAGRILERISAAYPRRRRKHYRHSPQSRRPVGN